MRILTVSDKVEPVLYSPYIRERVGQVDLILGCGDLPYYYLEYIVDLLDAPLFFVHGNHDRVLPAPQSQTAAHTPGVLSWAYNLHGRAIAHQGLLLAGFEGCPMYNPGAPYQYSEAEVAWQTALLGPQLWLNRLRYGRYLDILVTHAPARGIHDAEDVPHRGFVSYLALMRRYRPLLMVHGHQHIYNRNDVAQTDYGPTRVINTYGYRLLELAPGRPGTAWRMISIR